LRGVFQYCVTRYLIVWPFLGALLIQYCVSSSVKHDV
jgi:hypothetical protein